MQCDYSDVGETIAHLKKNWRKQALSRWIACISCNLWPRYIVFWKQLILLFLSCHVRHAKVELSLLKSAPTLSESETAIQGFQLNPIPIITHLPDIWTHSLMQKHNPKKLKLGDLGSTEEDSNIAKKANMTANNSGSKIKDEGEKNLETELSLSKIKVIFKVINSGNLH